jgi:cation diffusion facilitator CzcD-associated flavoprotein CzcO
MSSRDAESPVLIIGGGAAGLSTAAALARRGIRSTVLDRDDCIGGSWGRRYQSLKLHTIRRYSGLAHYPIPKDRPRYLSKDEYAAYLREYAEVLGLDVSLGERVDAVQEIPGSPDGMDWEVVTSRGIRRARVVVIATGHYAEASLPSWEGIEEFAGVVLQSSQYATGAAYRGQNALVIGLGNSGAEIAADLAAHGATSVSISVRTTPPIVTREMFKIIPVQLLGIALTPVGMPRVIDRIGAALRRISIGDLTRYGLGQAAWGPFAARKPAVIDAGFVKQLKQGRVVIRPKIARFDSTDVVYEDGSREAVDVVVAATGFRTGLEKILKVPGVIDGTGQPRFRSGRPTSASGLYFVGFDETVRGHLFEISQESKRLAVEVDRYLMR